MFLTLRLIPSFEAKSATVCCSELRWEISSDSVNYSDYSFYLDSSISDRELLLSSSFLEYILAKAAPPIPNPISSGNKLYDRGRNFFAFSLSTIDLFIFFSKPTPNLSYCVITSYFYHIVRGLKFLTSESGY